MDTSSPAIRLGVSSCLLGNSVRYDGQHKLDHFIRDTLGQYVEFVPVCPEVECGLSVPREAMRLVGDPAAPRLVTRSTGVDHTERMITWARKRVKQLERENLCGFIFKAKSPSSGMERVKVYNQKGGLSGSAPGMFAREFIAHFPLLPIEEEGRLHDANLRENFIERIFILRSYRAAVHDAKRLGPLVRFHERHKFLIQSHDTERSRIMGRLLANPDKRSPAAVSREYEALLLKALSLRATPRKHANVLQHMLGFLKKDLASDEKQEMLEVIDAYRAGLVPLIVPITLMRHHVRKYDVSYLRDQVYLSPHPMELKLRNHA